MLKIDSHTHILPEKLPNFAEKFGYGDFIHLEHHKPGRAKMMKGNSFFREIKSNCWDASERKKEYEEQQVKVQVVCTVPVMFSYWAKPADTYELAKFLNDDIARTCEQHPLRYFGLGTLPMQDIDLAIKEMERSVNILGLKGFQIGSNINDINLSDESFDPFYKACEELGASLMIHPWEMMGMESMRKYWLPWLVGMPAETTRAVCSMIFSGVFDKFPRLRVMFSHSGGSFLATIGRIEHGYRCRPDLVAIDNPNNPRNYLGSFWVDSITHDPMATEYALKLIGSDKICMGSDYPFPLGDLEFGAFLEEMNLPKEDLENIFYKSTCRWLGIDENELLSKLD